MQLEMHDSGKEIPFLPFLLNVLCLLSAIHNCLIITYTDQYLSTPDSPPRHHHTRVKPLKLQLELRFISHNPYIKVKKARLLGSHISQG